MHVVVDMFGIIAYDVTVSSSIPEFCKYDCILQKLNVDASRTEVCVESYNDLVPEMLGMIMGKDDRFTNQSIGDINLSVCTTKGDVNSVMFFMHFISFILKDINVTLEWNEELVYHIKEQLNALMQESVITLKSLKRFISEKIGEEEIVFNIKGTNKNDNFQYFILYIVGKSQQDIVDFSSIEKIIKDEFGKISIDLTDEANAEIKQRMHSDTQYSNIIKNGALKISQL